ncbi:MAG: DMT family transporter [Pseudomonadota bacterium]|nr:DMT family transporter [Pseudomonadota bacterium]
MPDSGWARSQDSAKSYWRALPANARGIIVILFSTVCFSAMHAAVRHVSAELSPIQIAFFRNLFGVIAFLPLISMHGLTFMRTRRLPMHLLRAGLNVLAMFAFFTAISITPLARVNALAFSAPLFTALLAVAVLGERFHVRRWSAIAIGFTGTLIVLRPGLGVVDSGSLLALASAAIWGVTMIVIKLLGRTESSATITGYMCLLLSLLSFFPALYVWRTPSAEAWMWLVFIGVVGTFAQMSLAEALKQADTTVVLPFDFMKLVWASMLGYLLFSEVPDIFTFLGALVIFASSFYLAYREGRQPGKAAADTSPDARVPPA